MYGYVVLVFAEILVTLWHIMMELQRRLLNNVEDNWIWWFAELVQEVFITSWFWYFA